MIILRSDIINCDGDWSNDRIIPCIIMFYLHKQILKIRSINSTKSCTHIFDMINAMLLILIKNDFKNQQNSIFNLSPHQKSKLVLRKYYI
jgi:hypothetical protein